MRMSSNKLEKFFQKELTSKIKDLLIIKSEDGTYHLFGRYKITPDKNGYYIVSELKYADVSIRFSSLKNAVTYCVFEKNNKKDYNKRLVELDDVISSLDASILMHKKLLKSEKPIEDKLIYLTKLEEEKRKKRILSEEMSLFVQTSKKVQSKTYQENTPR